MDTTPSAPPSRIGVFLVEDHEDMRRILHELICMFGFEVFEADCIETAVRDFPRSGSSVLLSDIGLPDGTGWTLLRRLREGGARPYAIAMSGFGTSADQEASRGAGYRHHLVKPIDLDRLEQLLDEARREIAGTK